MTKPWHMGTYLRVLSETYPMNTITTGLRWFTKIFASLCFGQKYSLIALEGFSSHSGILIVYSIGKTRDINPR